VDVADFWRFLERSGDATAHPRRRAQWLEHRLSRVAVDHIVDFQIHVDTARRPIDTWDMLGAANQVMDGLCSGDSFWYFQPWLIGQGQHWWRHAAQHPDNLADLPAVQALAGRRPQDWPDSEWPCRTWPTAPTTMSPDRTMASTTHSANVVTGAPLTRNWPACHGIPTASPRSNGACHG
jgi:hypothetical protein